MNRFKKLSALVIAFALCLSLAGCAGDADKKPDPQPEVSKDDLQNVTPPDVGSEIKLEGSASDIVKKLLDSNGIGYTKLEGSKSDDPNEVGSTSFSMTSDPYASIYITEFKSAEAAKKRSECYDKSGSHYNDGKEYRIIDYIAPVHFWLYDKYIIQYCSSVGTEYSALVGVFGEEFAGAGDCYGDKPIQPADTHAAVISVMENHGVEYKKEEVDFDPAEEGGLGALLETDYTVSEVESFNIISFESEEKASQYLQCFKENGTLWQSGDISFDVNYDAPHHIWLNKTEIITYVSETGELLQDLNEYFGREKMGAGYDYFRPDYSVELVAALEKAGFECYTSRGVGSPEKLYMYSPISICFVKASNGEVIHLLEFVDEPTAADHASRFSHDGSAYTGLEGESATSINFDRHAPTHFFRKGSAVVEYSSESGELLDVLDSVYGYQFAGPDYKEVTAQEQKFSAQYIRTDGFIDGQEYPYYVIIRSVEDLNRYYSQNKDIYDLEKKEKVYADTTIGWLDAIEKYDDEYFRANDLIMIVLEEGSGSNRHEVKSVIKNPDGSFAVDIARIVPEVGTEDMAEWHILLEIECGKINPLTRVNIALSEASMPDNPPVEYVVEDGGQFSYEELKKHLKDCSELEIRDLTKSVSKKAIKSFDEASEYAKVILDKGKQLWDWDTYIVSHIQRNDENKLWVAYLMTPFNENDDNIIIGGNHIVVFDDDGEIVGVWYSGS